MAKPCQKLFLVNDWAHWLFIYYFRFAHLFHCKDLPSFLCLYLPNFAETSLSDRTNHIKHLFANRLQIFRRWRSITWFFSAKSYLLHLKQSLFLPFLWTEYFQRIRLPPSGISHLHSYIISILAKIYIDILGFWYITPFFYYCTLFTPKLPPLRWICKREGLLLLSSVYLIDFFGERTVRIGDL